MQPGFYFVRFKGVVRLAFVRRWGEGEQNLIIELIDPDEDWGRGRVYLLPSEAERLGFEWTPRLVPKRWA